MKKITVNKYSQSVSVKYSDVGGLPGIRSLFDKLTSTTLQPVDFKSKRMKSITTKDKFTKQRVKKMVVDVDYYRSTGQHVVMTNTRFGKKGHVILERVPHHRFYQKLRGMVYFPIHVLSDLENVIKSNFLQIELIEHNAVKPKKTNIKYASDIILRPYQESYKEAVLAKPRTLIELKTGYGKTVTALNALCQLGHRFGVFILGRYIEKWIDDIISITNIKKEEICVVAGAAKLNKVVTKPKEFNKIKCFIFSISTINAHINNKAEEGLHPFEIFNAIKIQTVLIDEMHQSFNMQCKMLLFANVEKVIALTATLVSQDEAMKRIYRLIFDRSTRPRIIVKDDKYIYIYPIQYELPKYITENSSAFTLGGMYNHAKLEDTIRKNIARLNLYFDLVYMALEGVYLNTVHVNDDSKDNKVLIFFSTVHMCEDFVHYLKSKDIPSWMTVSKYTQEDDYDVVQSTNIIVSTVLSAGVALDIPKLVSVVQTINIGSEQANKQSLGRLRNLKGMKMRFAFLYSMQINQHRRYANARLEMWRPFTANVHYRFSKPYSLVLPGENERYQNRLKN